MKRIAFTLCVLAISAALAHAAETKPNILVILADDLGYGDIGVQGGQGGADAEHRCAGGKRRALHQRLCLRAVLQSDARGLPDGAIPDALRP